MRAVLIERFGVPPQVVDVADPVPAPGGVVIEVRANGICRSDWHAWMGHDSTVRLPHVPGHEMAGVVVATGADVGRVQMGERVTVPFACGCGTCRYCRAGQLHICDDDFQPGFTAWGSFAQYVAIDYADANVVPLPAEMDFVSAASLGCRFSTAYRAVVQQGGLQPNDWLAVHGCGGVGLSAIMIGKALGARVVGVDLREAALEAARQSGADHTVHSATDGCPAAEVLEVTRGGADVSLDALGSQTTAANSIACLRKQGTHVQVGLLLGTEADPPLPIGRVISHELELRGSHGMSATDYPQLLRWVTEGAVEPHRLVRQRIPLSQAAEALSTMNDFAQSGMTVIDDFER